MISKSEQKEWLKQIRQTAWIEINWTRMLDQTPKNIECPIRTWQKTGSMEVISSIIWVINGWV